MSLFTATIINAMQTAVDGTKCTDIEDKKVSVNYSIIIIDCSYRAMQIKYRKESVQITFVFVCLGRSKDTMIIKINQKKTERYFKQVRC